MKKAYALWYGFTALFLFIFLAPVAWRSAFLEPLSWPHWAQLVTQGVLLALAPLATWLLLREPVVARDRKTAVWWMILCAVTICELVHYWVIDRGHYFPPSMFADNTTWQVFMHGPILDLSDGALPHSYRFLPDAIVQLFQWLTGDFVVSRIAYRVLFNSLLLVAFYQLARVYVEDLYAGIGIGVFVVIYPLTILKYAGQFVDPLSHCSFIACILFAVRRYEPGFGPTLFAGLLAKESGLLMAICRFFYGENRVRAALAASIYTLVSLAIVLGVRGLVLKARPEFFAVSGVNSKHFIENLGWWREWILMYAAILGTLLPGTILGWKHLDRPFQWTTLTLLAGCFVSSLFFSWLSEIRNFMPAFMAMIVINLVWFQRAFSPKTSAA